MTNRSPVARPDQLRPWTLPLGRRAALGALLGAGIGLAKPALAAGNADYRSRLKPPQPLARLRVYEVKSSGRQSVSGGPDEDLLLVHPPQEITGAFQLTVSGFRGIYYIGASFNPAPMGWLNTPNGRRVEGIGALLRLRTHRYAVSRPFIYVARLRFRTSRIVFGDLLQVGGSAPVGEWGGWPDIYRHKIRAEPLFGWSGHHGGSFSSGVSHSDFIKAELGGVRHGYAADIDVTWGYQTEYVTPTSAFSFRPYKGPDGYGQLNYWNYVSRIVTRPDLAAESDPSAFFLSRGSKYVANDEYYSVTFGEGGNAGRGVWIVPPSGRNSILTHVDPDDGVFGARESGGALVWPQSGYPNNRPMVTGRVLNGAVAAPPTMVRDQDVGHGWRVTSRDALLDYIDGGYLA
ncbi:MAG: hypothetical protein U1E14_03165 [Geminicoccaceae bacterium]